MKIGPNCVGRKVRQPDWHETEWWEILGYRTPPNGNDAFVGFTELGYPILRNSYSREAKLTDWEFVK